MARDAAAERAELDRRIEGRTVCTEFAKVAADHPDVAAIKWRNADGGWETLSYREYYEQVRLAALGFRALGFDAGEFGVTLAANRPEHFIADLGILHAGGTSVGLYETLAPDQVAYVAGHCDATVAVVENAAQLEKFLKVRDELPRLKTIVMMEDPGPVSSEGIIGWDELLERGKVADASAFEDGWRAVKPEDVATLIYTSGTTGPPKAVMLTHANVLFHWETFLAMKIKFSPGERVISYLPLAHVAGHVGAVFNGMLGAATVYACPEITQLGVFLTEVHPTFFIGVPRVYEKLYAGINAALAAQPEELRTVVQNAIATGREWIAHQQKGAEPFDDLRARWEAAAPVCKAVLGRVGLDECWVALVGAAPIAVEVIEFFHALGLRMLEVWGMSELTAVATANPLEAIRIGSVGTAMPGAEVVLADGEILVRGGIQMAGYYKDLVKTAEAVDGEGWMHTGDIGRVDEDGYWYIVDRKKELIITAGGKNISPANLENALKHHPLIGQAAVIGDRRAYLTALIVLDPEVAPAWAAQRGVQAAGVAELAANADVRAEIERAVAEVNTHVARVENIRRFTILPTEWTIETDELTPTMKLKRRVINAKYADAIEGLYQV